MQDTISMRECVEQYTEGRNAWQLGVLGFFTKLQGMIPTLFVTVLCMGVPFWWPIAFSKSVTISGGLVFILMVSTSGFIALIGFVFLRFRSRRSLDIKAALHVLAHEIRDEQSKIFRRISMSHTGNQVDEHINFFEYTDRLCNHVRNYFTLQVKDNTVDVCIRLAIETSREATTQIVYSTFGRSIGLSPKRAETSVDIPSNEGIPRFLTGERGCQGILIYNDLRDAAKMGAFKMTDNEKKYADEVKTLMVAPLNGWDGKKVSMIGLLYVTSRNTGVFKPKHIDAMRFAADIVSTSIAFTVEQLKSGGRIKIMNRRQA